MKKTFFDASSYRCLPATTGLDAVKQNPVFAFPLKLNGEVFFQHSQHALHITGLEEPGYVRFLKVFIQENKLDDEWNEFLKEKDNAVQEQQTEEVPLQEEAESSEEVVEAPKEEIKD